MSLIREIRGQLSEDLLEPEDFWVVDRHGLGLTVRPSLVPKLQLFDQLAVLEIALNIGQLVATVKPAFLTTLPMPVDGCFRGPRAALSEQQTLTPSRAICRSTAAECPAGPQNPDH